ncbi:hypothetical protein HN51_016833 [Arachis hypogaea]|uniref:Eukaryotic translation initiation factor 4G n=1 Tax=Arachis hypogaea TaxID=3818 RepID=A0A445CUS7_ARAHY|nr:eukaryotic translation initiation factor 4G isoform X2 [Arachis hypogaea]RYR54661.1 hypothetical protein Ahy_A06g029968 isoform A [Arachis hypogaea]
MSFNQSKSDKSDAVYRKSGRSASFNQQRGSSGGAYGRGGGAAPSPSLSSNRSFNKKSNNAQGGQSRVNPSALTESNSTYATRTAPNGSHVQPQFHGGSDAPVTNITVKSSESSNAQRTTRAVPKAPTSQPPTLSSDSAALTTAAKGDASKAFPVQFGSISPGFMNGMAIPARTSSAPPNLDEQKRDQARYDSFKPAPAPAPAPTPAPPVPKQHPVKKDTGITDQSHAGTRAKKDMQVSALPPGSQMQKPSVVPLSGISMPMTYHQPQASVQFGGPNPQIQSQGMPTASHQMPLPMPLPVGNAPQVQQQVFVPGLQPHQMHQGLIHQSQNMSFTPQMVPQLPHQLGSMGISIGPQYSPQQGGKFAPRKTTPVKITHPETHEELRLDKRADTYSDGGSSGAKSYSSVSSQSQPAMPVSHPINYYPSHAPFYQPSSSSQITPNSQPLRFNYAVSQGPQNVSFMNSSSHSSLPVNKVVNHIPGIVESSNPKFSRDVHNAISQSSTGATSVSVKLSSGSGVVDSSVANSNISAAQKSDPARASVVSGNASSSLPQKGSETSSEASLEQSKLSGDSSVLSSLPKQSAAYTKVTAAPMKPSSAVNEEAVLVVSNNEEKGKESLSRSNSLKDNKKVQKEGQLQHPVVQSPTVSYVSSQAVERSTGDSETVVTKTNHSAAVISEDITTTTEDTLPTPLLSMPHAEAKRNGAVEPSTHVSAEGPVAQAADSLKKNDELDEFSQLDKLPKNKDSEMGENTEISSIQGCKRELDETTSIPECVNKNPTALGSSTDVCLSRDDIAVSSEAVVSSPTLDQNSSDIPETTSEHFDDGIENAGSVVFLPAPDTNDRSILDQNKVKTTSKAKKKRKEILQKADAAGSTSDLYNAYKGPEEKKDAVVSSEEVARVSTSGSLEQLSTNAAQPDAIAGEQCRENKAELDDWEDAADTSSPKLEVSDQTEQVIDGCVVIVKRYSRDFLLKFAEQCTDLPEGFEITADIAEALISANISSSCDPHPSPGRNIDRTGGMSRIDRRGGAITEEDKWSKVSNSFHSGMRLDSIGGNAGFRPVQGGNFGVLRNPRSPLPYAGAGGILSGPMQSMGNLGGMPRNSCDSERWQRASSFQQRVLVPSPPQSPLQMMHKAEKKYEIGKVTDVEEAKQRQLKAILNKLTPQNFEKLFEQVKAVNIDNAVTLTGVISQIFEKALMEPTFCEMYANFCSHLAAELPDFSEDNEKITFKRLLLNKCQEEFERGEREQEEANKADEGEVKQSNEQREEKRTKARRRMLGNIRLIGELYKKKMLTERIMHECIKKLLGQHQDPDEEDIEALCKLMSTIGEMIDHPKAKVHIDVYFERMKSLSNNMNLSSRVRFMLKDAIDLRKNKWQQRRKVEGPKKIEEVHRDATQERQAQTGRLGRGLGNNPARKNPVDFGLRGASMLPSPVAQMGGLRGLPSQIRGYGPQDARMEDRHEARILSVPMSQRLGDDSITLGPQGGLARGMSLRGSTAVSSSTSFNGYTNLAEGSPYSSREGLASRYIPDRFAARTASDQSSAQERNINYGNRDPRNADGNFDMPVVTSPSQLQGTAVSQIPSSERVYPGERLLDMSMAAIREYYSARDEKEVVLCVKDLNSPSFHPSMVSIWVTDSFERKNTERDLLAQLLVNLVKSQDGILSQAQLIKGFESVLSTLEDSVNDAPKAPEFLGRIFAKAVTEHVVSLKEIGQLIHDGGDEPGSLLEAGLAADVLGNTLEVIKMEKGDDVLSEIRTSSNLRLETFRPPEPLKSRKLESFI